MLSSSAAFKAAVRENSNTLFKATLTYYVDPDTTRSITLREEHVMEGSQFYSEGVSSDGSFDIGAAIIGKFSFSLLNDQGQYNDISFEKATITPQVGKKLPGGTTEWLVKGRYGIEQPETYGSVIKLTALDNMRKFEKPYSEVNTSYPATLQTILRNICTTCGVTLGNANFPNYSYRVQTRPTDENLTCLQMVSYVAQLAGCWAKCDTSGALRLGWYDKDFFNNSTPAVGTYANLDMLSSMSVYTDDVVITGVQVTAQDQITETGAGNKGETRLYGSTGYVIDLTGNPLVLYGQAQTCANFIGQRTVGLRFRPFNASAIGDPSIEAGDPAIITDYKGVKYNSYITTLTYASGAFENFACNAAYPGRHNAASYSAAAQILQEANRRVEQEKTAREIAIEYLNELIGDDASGLFMTQEVQPDGSIIYYMHDQPSLAESQIVWKLTANAFGISTDGGAHYPYILDVNGDAVLNRIYAIGIDATYIDTGRLEVSDGRGDIRFLADYNTGQVLIQDPNGNKWDTSTGELVMTSVVNQAVNKAKELEVGGTNLLIDTNAPSLTKVAATKNRYFSDKTHTNVEGSFAYFTSAPIAGGIAYAARFYIKANSPAGQRRGLCFYSGGSVPLKSGKKYTMSCMAYCTSGNKAKIQLGLGTTKYPASPAMELTSSWRRYSWTFTYQDTNTGGNNGTRAYFYAVPTNYAYATNVYMCGFKIEEGEISTAWSLNPEDTKKAASKEAETYTNTAMAKRGLTTTVVNELKSAVTQDGIYKTISNNLGGQNFAVMQGGKYYINASVIKSGTRDASLIRAGFISSQAGWNYYNNNRKSFGDHTYWNLSDGYLQTKNMHAKNATVQGLFKTGDAQRIEIAGARINGYRTKGTLNRDGYIDYSAGIYDIPSRQTKYGLYIDSKYVFRINTKCLTVYHSDAVSAKVLYGSASAYYKNKAKNTSVDTKTGVMKLKVCDGDSYGTAQLEFCNGLLVGFTGVLGGLASWSNY